MTRLVLVPSKVEFDRLYPGDGEQLRGPILAHRSEHEIWAVCGIGAGVAGLVCEKMLNLYDKEVKEVFLLGIAGAFPNSGLQVGQVVQARSECFADLGYRDDEGFHNLDAMGLPLLRASYGSVGAETGLEVWDESQAKAHFITRNMMTTDLESARLLEKQYEAQVENMEGASVALASAMRQTHFYEVRSISNMVGPRDKSSWRIDDALEALREWYQAQPKTREEHLNNVMTREHQEARTAYFEYLDSKEQAETDGYDEAFRNLF